MKVVRLTSFGTGQVLAHKIRQPSGCFYSILHGEFRQGGWEARVPLGSEDFPCTEESPDTMPLGGNYGLQDLCTEDPVGNQLKLLVAGQKTYSQLVLFNPVESWSAGRLVSSWWGPAKIITTGIWAPRQAPFEREQAECPVFLIGGPAAISWHWTGYTQEYHAVFDGERWDVSQR